MSVIFMRRAHTRLKNCTTYRKAKFGHGLPGFPSLPLWEFVLICFHPSGVSHRVWL